MGGVRARFVRFALFREDLRVLPAQAVAKLQRVCNFRLAWQQQSSAFEPSTFGSSELERSGRVRALLARSTSLGKIRDAGIDVRPLPERENVY